MFLTRCRNDLLIMYRCNEFVVSNSKFHTFGRSQVYVVLPPPVLWHAHLAPLGSRYRNDTFLAKVAGVPPRLNPVASKV